MSNRMYLFLIGWVLIFGIVACAPRGEQEKELNNVITATPASPGTESDQEEQTTPEDQPYSKNGRDYAEYEIVTLLPRDAIPAIDDPQFLSADEADAEYAPDELVIGVNYDGDARAYSIPYLSGHEIVNDTVGGRKIAVTW